MPTLFFPNCAQYASNKFMCRNCAQSGHTGARILAVSLACQLQSLLYKEVIFNIIKQLIIGLESMKLEILLAFATTLVVGTYGHWLPTPAAPWGALQRPKAKIPNPNIALNNQFFQYPGGFYPHPPVYQTWPYYYR